MKKFALLLVSIVFFAACGGAPQASQPASFQLQNTQASQPSPQQSSQPASSSDQTQLPTQQGAPVKTLSDFQKISATQATITTNKGDITFTLYSDKSPLTVTNFLTLAKSGFYDGIKFHRIIPGFMAQVGDPLTKDDTKQAMWGTGGPGYTIQDEYDPSLKFDTEGVVAMANTGVPNSGGSQIFITYAPYEFGNGKYPIFGKVTSGMDVLKNLVIGDQILHVTYK